jgi:hypothetical protein
MGCREAIPSQPLVIDFNLCQRRVRRLADAEPMARLSRALAAALKRAM